MGWRKKFKATLAKGLSPTSPNHARTDDDKITEDGCPSTGQGPKGFLDVASGDQFDDDRYTIRKALGKGVYSSVWLAQDAKLDRPVALKILSKDFYNGGIKLFERQIVRRIRNVAATSKHPGRLHVMSFYEDFEHQTPDGTHVCLSFDLLGPSIHTQMCKAKISRLPYQTTKSVTKQLLMAIDFLHTECGIVHTDIQTNNILLQDRSAVAETETSHGPLAVLSPDIHVKLADFGLACWVDEHLTDRIQPPVLRAPEITLEAPWESSVDVYDLGCLVYYLVTGSLPFPGRPSSRDSWTAEDDRLRLVTEIFGSVPEIVLQNASRADHFYDENGELRRTPKSQRTPNSPHTPLEDVIDVERQRRGSLSLDMPLDEIPLFCDFLRGALATDPRKRLPAGELSRHRWLQI